MLWLLITIYGWIALTALSNLLLMRRPRERRTRDQGPEIAVLIPARDEERNLRRLLPQLLGPNPGLRVYVYDDDSNDGTAHVAQELGATTIRGGKLPEGWSGKNWACHRLGQVAAEDTDAEWLLFLDADVTAAFDLIPALRGMANRLRPRVGVLTGFPTILPGKGIEPIFLAWVGWALLCSSPFGFQARTGVGHSRFTNGQIHLWRSRTYTELWPNERVKGAMLEDVLIGRLLSRHKIGLEVANLSSILSVRMYETWRETLDGMSKNSYEIAGNTLGSAVVALWFVFLGWGWLFAGHAWWIAAGLLALSGVFVALAVRASVLLGIVMPVVLTIASYTVLRSISWHRKGVVRWKGRTYS